MQKHREKSKKAKTLSKNIWRNVWRTCVESKASRTSRLQSGYSVYKHIDVSYMAVWSCRWGMFSFHHERVADVTFLDSFIVRELVDVLLSFFFFKKKKLYFNEKSGVLLAPIWSTLTRNLGLFDKCYDCGLCTTIVKF